MEWMLLLESLLEPILERLKPLSEAYSGDDQAHTNGVCSGTFMPTLHECHIRLQ
jgi:hypothetical protein